MHCDIYSRHHASDGERNTVNQGIPNECISFIHQLTTKETAH